MKGRCYPMNGKNSTRQWLISEWQGYNKTIDLLDRIKIVNHLILNCFWREENLLNVVLEFDGIGKIVCSTHIVRLKELLELK